MVEGAQQQADAVAEDQPWSEPDVRAQQRNRVFGAQAVCGGVGMLGLCECLGPSSNRINAAAGKCVVHHLFASSMSGGYRGQYYRKQRDPWGEAGGYDARGGGAWNSLRSRLRLRWDSAAVIPIRDWGEAATSLSPSSPHVAWKEHRM